MISSHSDLVLSLLSALKEVVRLLTFMKLHLLELLLRVEQLRVFLIHLVLKAIQVKCNFVKLLLLNDISYYIINDDDINSTQ